MKIVYAVVNAAMSKFTVIISGSHSTGNYRMLGPVDTRMMLVLGIFAYLNVPIPESKYRVFRM